ncbi:hypothetical protein BDY19DRAFT_998889, partial [Irpex rosettiformis]
MSSLRLSPLSMPNLFDDPAIMWATEVDIPDFPGLYVSPTSRTLPVIEPIQSRQRRTDSWPPLPWQWFYTRFAKQDTYWTALCPTSIPYEGLLEALGNNEVVETMTAQGLGWRLANAESWQSLEHLLQRMLSAMTAAWSLDFQTPLLVRVKQLSPWPLAYRYADVWPTRKQAKSAVNTARAVFKIIIASIVYASSMVPEDWLEFLHRRHTLTTEETNLIRRSPICQTTDWISGEPFQRTGCILDMRADLPLSFLEEVKRITEKFNLPIWFYYGDSLSHRHTNPWYDVYLPSDTDIKTCKMYGHSVTAMNWNNDRFGDNTWNTASPTVSYPSTSRTGWSPPMHQPHTGPNSPQPSSPLSSSPFDHLISSPALTSTRPPITASQR